MKILFLSDLNSIHTKKWVKTLSEKGCDLLVFGLSKPTDHYYESLQNVQIAFADQMNVRYRSKFSKLSYFKHIGKIKQLYQEYQPDIVHAHYATSYGTLGSLLKKKPFLISVWGTDVFDFPQESGINRYLLKRNLAKTTEVFSTSKRMAVETKKYTNKPIHVVPFGVNTKVFQPKEEVRPNEAPQKLVIGIIKTLEKNYGIDTLIKAFKKLVTELHDLDLELQIAGEGSEEENLKKLVRDFQLEEQVKFLGYINHSEVQQAFQKMDMAVIASLTESFGVSAVEAAACGLPVVATNVGGLPEVVIDGVTGLLCEADNVNDLAEKMSQLVQDRSLRLKMGKAGRQLVLDHYDWDKNVDLMIDHYQRILSS
jgi:glycosyltransferase involved in cell wall biosynthesis